MKLNQSRVIKKEKELNNLSECPADNWSQEKEDRRKEILKLINQLEDINSELPLEVIKCACDAIVIFRWKCLTFRLQSFS